MNCQFHNLVHYAVQKASEDPPPVHCMYIYSHLHIARKCINNMNVLQVAFILNGRVVKQKLLSVQICSTILEA